MISAVSSQTATLNPLAYTALDGELIWMPLPLMSNTNSSVSVLAGSKKPTPLT
jgi:hypothetical protein